MGKQPPQKKKLWTIFNIILICLCSLALGMLLLTFKSSQSSNMTNNQDKKSSHRQSKNEAESKKQAAPEKSSDISWIPQETEISVPILMYHAVHVMDPSEAASANLIVDPSVFEEHIKRLAEEGYYFLSPEEAYKALTENSLPNNNAKIVWLTFDDGNADFYTVAYPILKKYQAKATNNIITDYVAKASPANLTLDQMLEMKENGMSFQSHTVSHPNLAASSPEKQAYELAEAKTYLDQTLSQDTIAIAYPSGKYNQTTLDTAKKSYKLGITTNEGLASIGDGLLSLDRIRILPTTTPENLLSTIQN
ncbi:polysaccharide deacetylase family protein [Streptococcus chenjunshii]|uniref:Polysaccharide deacetylase family protein n=1 Tax=Streptococcus chenjunshii TaxID=2173853 RepID=A0A372KN07_9STRE|nr:polysaccharide deacetylase family protein [Streptococcus chenjunshii]AXQ78785.1 polysaccharide deacetylase family protein [Streptococcus chenjunshii]RFU51546.1 polysaccharide deacetylase family protein [Streptococcus chenjunshii]RFU53665.1 polysaccharide deacetylase family protein [Streptococcus chenjunshii]